MEIRVYIEGKRKEKKPILDKHIKITKLKPIKRKGTSEFFLIYKHIKNK